MVRVNMKPKSGITKGHDPKGSKDKHEVTRTYGNSYHIDRPTKREVFRAGLPPPFPPFSLLSAPLSWGPSERSYTIKTLPQIIRVRLISVGLIIPFARISKRLSPASPWRKSWIRAIWTQGMDLSPNKTRNSCFVYSRFQDSAEKLVDWFRTRNSRGRVWSYSFTSRFYIHLFLSSGRTRRGRRCMWSACSSQPCSAATSGMRIWQYIYIYIYICIHYIYIYIERERETYIDMSATKAECLEVRSCDSSASLPIGAQAAMRLFEP